jgi:hypothetical protein
VTQSAGELVAVQHGLTQLLPASVEHIGQRHERTDLALVAVKDRNLDQAALCQNGKQALHRRLDDADLLLEPGVRGKAALAGVQVADVAEEPGEVPISITARFRQAKRRKEGPSPPSVFFSGEDP